MTQNNEREAFEKWFKTWMPETYSQHINNEDIEATRQYHSAWLAWKARAQSQNEQPKQIPDGWISVDDRLPKKYTEVLVYPQPNEYSLCASYGKFKSKQIDDGWFYGEYEAGIGHENYACKVTHWIPLPPAPTTSLTSETNTEVGE